MVPNEPYNNHPAPHVPAAPVVSASAVPHETAASAPAAPHTPSVASPMTRPRSSSPLFTLGVGCLVLVIIGWLVVTLLGVTRGGEANELDGKLNDLTEQLQAPAYVAAAAEYNSIDTVLSKIKDLRAQRLLFDPTWQTIKNNVPKDVQFTSFTLGDDATFRIAGVGRSITSVAQFSTALTEAKFKTVTPLAVDKQADKDLYNFSISFKRGAGQ